jgi:predicted metalloprotease with PDZ domain
MRLAIIASFMILYGSPFVVNPSRRTSLSLLFIGTGFTFQDRGRDQILVSVQKPMGIILEQDCESQLESDKKISDIVVVPMDAEGNAARAGIRVGDELLAVQNRDVVDVDLSVALAAIARAPTVVNLRFQRRKK